MKKRRKRKSVSKASPLHHRIITKTGLGNSDDTTLLKLKQAAKSHPESIESALNLAEHLYRQGHHDEIVDTLKSYDVDYPFPDHSLRQRYNRLLAFGHLVLGDPVQADKTALRGMEESPDSADFRWLLTRVKSELREYDEVIRIGTEWLKLNQCNNSDSSDPSELWFTNSDRALLHRKIAMALCQKRRCDEAEEFFNLALKTDPQAPWAYLDLASMLRRNGNQERALEIIDRGLSRCQHIDELRMFKSILKRRATIAACMIVKDEEELIPGCLDSIRDWVDEIIVVDTGSSDQTVPIAKSYGARLFHQKWKNDFSLHRNYSIEQAESDWILIIDADERIPADQLPDFLRIIEDDRYQVIALNVINIYAEDSIRISAPNSMRLFKRNLNLRYEGIVHNALMVPDGIEVFRAPVCLEHLGYDLSPDKMKAKIARTRSLLEKQLEDNPDDGFAWFNLAQLFRSRLAENFDEYTSLVLKAARRAIELCGVDDPKARSYHLMALDQLAWTNHFLGNQKQAQLYAEQALNLKPDYLDPLILVAHIYAAKGDHEKAIEAYQAYLMEQKAFQPQDETDALILLHSDSRAEAHYRIAISSEQLKHTAQARNHYLKALEQDSTFREANYALGMIHLKENELEEAEKYFNRQFEYCQPKGRAALGLAEVCYRRNQPEKIEKYVQEAIRTGVDQPEVLKTCRSYFQRTNQSDKEAELNSTIIRSLRSVKGRATISAAMIVKDEQELLPGCLDSIKDWVDEIIIVDTGSTDRTVQIAKSFGARIFHQPWEGDFSKHRNYSIEQATCDWVFIIDADERFLPTDVAPLLELTNDTKHQIISINVFNLYDGGEHKLTSMNSVRFFRRELKLRYEGIVHNQINNPDRIPITRAPFSLEHLGYDLSRGKMDAKLERTQTLLEKQIEENPDFAFAWFNLAQLLRGELLNNYEKYAPQVIDAAQRVVQLTDPSNKNELPIHLMALDQLAWTWFCGDDFEKAEEYARKALLLKKDYLDPLILLGHIYSKSGNPEKGIAAYEEYLEVQARFDEYRELDALILYNPDSRAAAFYGMAADYEVLGNAEQAKANYLEVLKVNPTYRQTNLLVANVYLKENNLDLAKKHFLAQLDKEDSSIDANIGLALVYFREGQFRKTEDFYNRALQIDPKSQIALVSAGSFYLKTDCKEMADELFQKVLSIQNVDDKTRRLVAEMYFNNSCFVEAAEVYEQILKDHPEASDAYNDLGNCHYKLGNFKRAEEVYRTALKSESPLAVTHRNLGLTLGKLNMLAEAIKQLELYYQMEPDQHQILTIISRLHIQAGDFNSALDSQEQYLRVEPHDSTALGQLAETYLLMGHKDAAILGYRRALQVAPESKQIQDRLAQLESLPVSSHD